MDNEVFRRTYRAVNERFCPFEKSILTNNCGSDAAQAQCLELLDRLRRQARFALKATDEHAALPAPCQGHARPAWTVRRRDA